MNSKNVFVIAGCMTILIMWSSPYAMTVSSQLSSSPFSSPFSDTFSPSSLSLPPHQHPSSSSSHQHLSNHDVGFRDGCADANTLHPKKTTDLHFNRHSNAHHHSRIYLEGYAEGLIKCKR